MTLLATGPDAGAPVRFQTEGGEAIAGFDQVWETLHEFYGAATPSSFTVVVKQPGGPSQFNSAQARLLLPRDTLHERGAPTLVHEGSHVCLSRLTGGASELEALRFVDEGLASLFEHRVAGSLPQFEKAARNAAALQLAAGNLSFEKLARWSVYFGVPPKRNAYAYSVGAAFDLYLLSTFGKERFQSFLAELGRERELDKAVRKAFGRSAAQLEAEWIASLEEVKVEKPVALAFEPKQGATAVPVATRELKVTMNVEMSPTTCVLAECGPSNVCYSGARWASPRELVIVADGPLLPKHRYRISLGIDGRCLMSSLDGLKLQPITWEFETE
jgi:hypothetical protein